MAGGGTVTFGVDGVIGLTNTIVVANDTVLDATGHRVTISGSNAVSLFTVNPGVNFLLTNLTLANGLAQATLVGTNFTPALGGAICSTGMVVAVQCVFSNNSAEGSSGNPIYDNPNAGFGGAIYNAGTLLLRNSVFTGNLAVGGSGEPYFAQPAPSPGQEGSGGAIYSGGSAVIINCDLVGNTAQGGSGGDVYEQYPYFNPPAPSGGAGGPANGGAVCSIGSLIVSNSTFSANAVLAGRGGNGGAGPSPPPFGSFAEPGSAGGPGGNPGNGNGGALCCINGNGVVVNSTFSGNSAGGGNGGNGGAGSAASGGFTALGGNGANGANGGNGIGGASCSLGGSLSIIYCTIASNRAAGGVAGLGALGGAGAGTGANGANGANGAPGIGQGDSLGSAGGTASVRDTILAADASLNTNIFGAVTDAGHNINSDATGVLTNATSLNATNPKLGPLGYNGGPTPTIPLLAGSPAMDAAEPSAFPPTDQRGYPRPYGLGPDIGAFEFTVPPQLTAMTVSGAGAQITVSDQAGDLCVVQVSSNLVIWSSIFTNTVPPDGTLVIADPAATGQQERFYRVVRE
jgi:hypothetical protein